MSLCTKALTGAYNDDKRETLNSLLRVKTPSPKNDKYQEISIRTASCVCFPLKCLEGIGMITFGAILWLVPCTICKIETVHEGTDVSVKKMYPGLRKPHIPCHYKDTYHVAGKKITDTGWAISYLPPQRLEGEKDYTRVSSSLTGYECLSSGVSKIVSTLISMVCCPIKCATLTCCNTQDV